MNHACSAHSHTIHNIPTDILKFFKRAPRNIGFLLDVGHLKVSSKTENFDLIQSLKRLNKIVSGYHLSENNFFEDQNAGFSKNTWFVKLLKIECRRKF